MTESRLKPEFRSPYRRLAASILAVACLLYAALAWKEAFELRAKVSPLSFEAYFIPGLVETVSALRSQGVVRVLGPLPDVSPSAFQRLSEMLYPVAYVTPVDPTRLRAGDVYILFPWEPIPVPSVSVCEAGAFRTLKVIP